MGVWLLWGHPCILKGIPWRSHCGRIICTWRMGYEFWFRHGCWRLVWWFQENSVWPLHSCVWGGSDQTGTLCRGVICVVERGVGPIFHLQLIHNHSDECKFLYCLLKSYLTSMGMNFMIFWTMIFWWGWHCGGRPHCGTAGWCLGWLEVSWSLGDSSSVASSHWGIKLKIWLTSLPNMLMLPNSSINLIYRLF